MSSERDDMPGSEERQTVNQLQSGLKLLERSVPVFPPNLALLERQLAEHRQSLRRRLYRDFAIFIMVAVFVLSGTIALLSRVPVVWLAVQAAALLPVPLVFLLHRRKRVNDV